MTEVNHKKTIYICVYVRVYMIMLECVSLAACNDIHGHTALGSGNGVRM